MWPVWRSSPQRRWLPIWTTGSLVLLLTLPTGVAPAPATASNEPRPTGTPLGWAVAAPAAALPLPVPLSADWPTYMANPARTGVAANESVLAPGNVSGLRVLWTAATPGVIEDSPVVADGTVYVSSWDGSLSAYYLTNGTLRWRADVGNSTFSQCYFSTARGPTATATVLNGTVYIMGGDPYLYALNASTGAILWKVSEKVNSPSSGDYNWASPLVYGKDAYLGIASACNSPGAQGMVEEVNLNGTTHSVVHTFAVVPTGGVLGGVWSTSAIDPAANLLWVTSGDGPVPGSYGQSVIALNATDLTLVGSWQVPTACCDYDFGAGPTLFHDASGRSLVGALNKNGVFYALNRSNVSTPGWRPVWTDNISWYANSSQNQAAGDFALAPAAFDGTTLFVGGGFARLANGTNVSGTLRAIDPATGSLRWTQPTDGIVRAGLAGAPGLIVDAADRPDNAAATLEVRAATNGTVLLRFPVNGTINGPPTVSDGVVLFGSGNWSLDGRGTLWALATPLTTHLSSSAVLGGLEPTVQFSATTAGGVPPYEYRWTFGDGSNASALPAPSHAYDAPGNFTVNLTVTDAAGETTNASMAVHVEGRPVVIDLFAAVPAVVALGGSTTLLVSASGGFGSLQYVYQGLPPGCVGNGTHALTCTPTATGRYAVGVTAEDAYGESGTAVTALTVEPASVSALVLLGFLASPATVPVGSSTELETFVTGGAGPYHYRYSGLPPGCLTADTAPLSCVPGVPGNFTPSVNVTDGAGQSAGSTTALRVLGPAPPAPLRLLAFLVSPSEAVLGENVTWVSVVDGGVGGYSYSYSELPAGCASVNASEVRCSPTASGAFTTGVTVRDAAGATVNGSAPLVIALPPAAPSSPSLLSTFPWFFAAGFAVLGFVAGVVLFAVGRRHRFPPNRPE